MAAATEVVRLPCTARELETALHAVCDHGGLWNAKMEYAPGGCLVLVATPGLMATDKVPGLDALTPPCGSCGADDKEDDK